MPNPRTYPKLNLGTPKRIPPCYNTLQDVQPQMIKERLQMLWCFSELISQNWKLMSLNRDEVKLIQILAKMRKAPVKFSLSEKFF